jgi:hypothetical protein
MDFSFLMNDISGFDPHTFSNRPVDFPYSILGLTEYGARQDNGSLDKGVITQSSGIQV